MKDKVNNTTTFLSLFENVLNMLPKHTDRHIYESDKFDIDFEDGMTIDEIRRCYDDAKELLDEIGRGRESFYKTIKFNKDGTISDWGCISPNTDDRDEYKKRNVILTYSIATVVALAVGTASYIAYKGGLNKWISVILKA